MIPFLDTSALVKRYVSEKGSDTVRSLFRRGRPAVVRIAYAEVASALGRLWRAGRVAEDAMRVAIEQLDDDFGMMQVVEVRTALVRRVPALVMARPLRAYDAVQLAAALALRDQGAAVQFWTADKKLAESARSEDLRATLLS